MADQERTRASRSRWLSPRVIGALVVLAILLVFIVQNRRTVHVTFLVLSADLSLAWALIAAAVLGAVIAVAVPRLRRFL